MSIFFMTNKDWSEKSAAYNQAEHRIMINIDYSNKAGRSVISWYLITSSAK